MSREHNPRRNDREPPRAPQNEVHPIPLRSTLDTDLSASKDALEIHLETLEADGKSQATIDSHERRVNRFLDWLCPHPALTDEENAERPGPDIRRTDEITGRHFHSFKLERSSEVKKITVKTEMDTVRKFVESLEAYDAVQQGTNQLAESPSLSGDEERREDDAIDVDRARQITEYLRKYEWGSEGHAFWELIWTTGMRLGGAHSIDETDIKWEQGQIQLRHRPETGTTLKNGAGMGIEGGERNANVSQTVLDAIEDWVDHPDRANDPVAEGGRVPLFPNDDGDGRRGKQYLRDLTYAMTRPCAYGAECPHDRDPNTCDAAQSKNKAYSCPSSTSPHPIRKGAITRMRDNDVPRRIVSHEVDASEDVIDKHYDDGDEADRAEIRREYLERDDDYSGE